MTINRLNIRKTDGKDAATVQESGTEDRDAQTTCEAELQSVREHNIAADVATCGRSYTENLAAVREHNIAAIVAYIENGCVDTPNAIGIELEQIVVHKDGAPVSYSEEQGIRRLLETFAPSFDTTIRDGGGELLGLAREGATITLEPAAQVELSAGPFTDLRDALDCLEAFEAQLAEVLAPVEQRAFALGYHPNAKALDLELIPKQRYGFMNHYLGSISEWGPRMMRGTASTQISIDYSSVDDCLRKVRLAYALVPILSLISDNAPRFEGGPRPHALMRTEVWRYCDPDRCELIPGVMDSGFSLQNYAEYLLDTPAILVPCKEGEHRYTEERFGEIYAETRMERADIEHALSMLFNDVRLKSYIEIRPGDSLPAPYAIAYAAFVKGLFYCADNLDLLDRLFSWIHAEDIDAAKTALMEHGYAATVYGSPVAELIDELMSAAGRGLPFAERALLNPLAELTARRTTLAELAL